MTLEEYVEISKKELDEFKENYLLDHKNDPENWHLEMGDGEWVEQELSFRF